MHSYAGGVRMISAIKVNGLWDEGYVLSEHTISSKYIGEDPFGRPQFDKEYTELGKLLYSMKYNGHIDTSDQIVALSSEFVLGWLRDKEIGAVIPSPATKDRVVQPVYVIAEKIAKLLGTYYSEGVLSKMTQELTKDIPKEERQLQGAIRQNLPAKKPCNVLLIDDLYSSGQTANECVRVLREDENIRKVYFLAITKTK